MIRNRGCEPDTKEFYRHIHPVQDLIRYIGDDSANDDPADQTLGAEFKFRIYSQRWGHPDQYTLIRNAQGWELHHIAINGQCDSRGHPYLYQNFEQDSICYPNMLPAFMERLWLAAAERGLSFDEVQTALSELADWVSTCERATPSGPWDG